MFPDVLFVKKYRNEQSAWLGVMPTSMIDSLHAAPTVGCYSHSFSTNTASLFKHVVFIYVADTQTILQAQQ